jgi:hypothetical protein
MSSRVPSHIRPDQIEGIPLARGRHRAGLGPVGSSMIDLIGASLLAQGGAQMQPQAAIWAKI